MASWSGPSGGYAPPRAPPPPWTRGRGGEGRVDRRRTVAALLLFLAVILSGVSAATAWWFDSVSNVTSGGSTTSTNTLTFAPGSTSYVSCGSSYVSPCTSNFYWDYASTGLAALGSLYVAVHVAAILAAVLGFVCALFMAMGATHRGWGRWHFHLTHLLALLAGVLMVIAPILLLLLQPGIIGQSTAGTAPYLSGPYEAFLGPEQSSCGVNTPNSSFWGSCTFNVGGAGNSYQTSWGAGLGWYAALAAAFLFLVGGGLFLTSHPEESREYSEEERGARGRAAHGYSPNWDGSASSSPYGPGPLGSDDRELVPSLGYLGAAVVSNRTSCRACGHLNMMGAVICTRCHTPLS